MHRMHVFLSASGCLRTEKAAALHCIFRKLTRAPLLPFVRVYSGSQAFTFVSRQLTRCHLLHFTTHTSSATCDGVCSHMGSTVCVNAGSTISDVMRLHEQHPASRSLQFAVPSVLLLW